MAGKNQHYIPQFLQRGFSCQAAQGFSLSSKKDKQKAQVWIFERENANKRLVCKAGADPYFYGPENSSVDTTITDAENLYGKLVNDLRSHRKDTAVEEKSIPELLAHMIVRSKNIRQTISELGGISSSVLTASLPDNESMTNFFINYFQTNPDKLGENLPADQRQSLRGKIQEDPKFIQNLITDGKIMGEFIPQFLDIISLSLSEIDVNEIARNAHIDTLSESIEPKIRVNMYTGLHWFLSVKKAGSYILGDGLVICQKTTGEYESALLASDDFQHVFLPISSQHLIIGTKEPTALDLDIESINHAIARMSNEFFIASQKTEREVSYQKKLGEHHIDFLNKQTIEMTAIADQHWTN
jgi:Protein of unknown function (DUF4238)